MPITRSGTAHRAVSPEGSDYYPHLLLGQLFQHIFRLLWSAYSNHFRDRSKVQQEKRQSTCEPRHPVSRSEEHTSELQSLMRISYAVFCLTNRKKHIDHHTTNQNTIHTH